MIAKFLFLISLLCVSACTTKPAGKSESIIESISESISKPDVKSMWIQISCSLVKRPSTFLTFPGQICQFLDDGSFISADEKHIRRFSSTKEILWERPGHFHHQVNLTSDKKRILVLTSEIAVRNGKKERDDIFLILDLDGKEIHRQNAYHHIKSLRLKSLNYPAASARRILGVDVETTHFNSIYEIPPNGNESAAPWLKAGNIIVNSLVLGVLILSPDLSKVHYHEQLPFSHKHQIHDLQVTPAGEFLFFNNIVNSKDSPVHSAVQKYNPVEKKIVLSVTARPLGMFYSPACGGAQEIGDLIFFSHVHTGGYYYSKKDNTIFDTIPGTHGNTTSVSAVQQLKLIHADNFLKNSGHGSE